MDAPRELLDDDGLICPTVTMAKPQVFKAPTVAFYSVWVKEEEGKDRFKKKERKEEEKKGEGQMIRKTTGNLMCLATACTTAHN